MRELMVKWLTQGLSIAPQHSRRDFIHAGRFLHIQRNKSFKNVCNSDSN